MKPDFIKVLGLDKVLAGNYNPNSYIVNAEHLQKALEEKCKVIYADDSATLSSTFWTTEKQPSDKHQAFIFGVTEIVKEPCKHEPEKEMECIRGAYYYICKHCGEKLKPVAWEVEG